MSCRHLNPLGSTSNLRQPLSIIEPYSLHPVSDWDIINIIMARETVPSRINQVLDSLDKKSKPRPFFEAQIEVLTAQIAKKQSESTSPFVESPFFPGILFRKSGTIERIERENTEPWENIFDYLNRRYRIEQVSQKTLIGELGITLPTIRSTLLAIGIPPLRSSEYKNPQARAVAARWEDPKVRTDRSQKIRGNWQKNREKILSKNHSADADALRSKTMTRISHENPRTVETNIRKANAGSVKARQKRMRVILGDDVIARMTEVFVDRGLSSVAAARELGNKVKPELLYAWAVKEGIIKPEEDRAKKRVTTDKRVTETKSLKDDGDLWNKLPGRQEEALLFLFDEKGRVRKLDEVGEDMGMTKAGVSVLIIKAKANLEKLKKGESIRKVGKRPLKPTL